MSEVLVMSDANILLTKLFRRSMEDDNEADIAVGRLRSLVKQTHPSEFMLLRFSTELSFLRGVLSDGQRLRQTEKNYKEAKEKINQLQDEIDQLKMTPKKTTQRRMTVRFKD